MKSLLTGLALALFAVCSIAGEVNLSCTVGDGTTADDMPDSFEIRWKSSTGENGIRTLPLDACNWQHTDLDPGQSMTYEAYAVRSGVYSDPTEQITVQLHPVSDTPPDTITPPIYIAPVIPSAPNWSFSCSGNITCKSE